MPVGDGPGRPCPPRLHVRAALHGLSRDSSLSSGDTELRRGLGSSHTDGRRWSQAPAWARLAPQHPALVLASLHRAPGDQSPEVWQGQRRRAKPQSANRRSSACTSLIVSSRLRGGVRVALLCEGVTGASVWQGATFLLAGVWVQRFRHATEPAELTDFSRCHK